MVRGSGAVMLPAVLSGVMPRAVMLRRVLCGWIAAWWFACGTLLSRGNSRQEKCCRHYQKKTLHWNLPFLNPL